MLEGKFKDISPARRCSRRCAVMVPCFQSPPAAHSLVHIPPPYHQDKCNVDDRDDNHVDNDGDDDEIESGISLAF